MADSKLALYNLSDISLLIVSIITDLATALNSPWAIILITICLYKVTINTSKRLAPSLSYGNRPDKYYLPDSHLHKIFRS